MKTTPNLNLQCPEKTDKVDVDVLSANFEKIDEKVQEVFTNASNGKIKVAEAITGKGIATSPSETFDSMAEKINQIKSMAPGNKYFQVWDSLTNTSYRVLSCLYGKTKQLVVVWYYDVYGTATPSFWLYENGVRTLTRNAPLPNGNGNVYGSMDNDTFVFYGEKKLYFISTTTLSAIKTVSVADSRFCCYVPSQQHYYVANGYTIVKYDLAGNVVVSTPSVYLNPTWFSYCDKYIYILTYDTTAIKVYDLNTLDLISEIPNAPTFSYSPLTHTDKYLIQVKYASTDTKLILYDKLTLQQIKTVNYNPSSAVWTVWGVKAKEDIVYIMQATKIVELNLETGAIIATYSFDTSLTNFYVGNYFTDRTTAYGELIFTNGLSLMKMFV